ncbi:MAG: hypothetical protein Q4E86_10195, partial [Lachnospiraceae bacterium]|nr:hypothetical protein [Lachnospiraceae bacterium]
DQKTETRMVELEERFDKKMERRITESELRMKGFMKEELAGSENMVLRELDRVHEMLDKKIDRVQQDVNDMKQYYQIARLEDTNITLVFQMVQSLNDRVERLEKMRA